MRVRDLAGADDAYSDSSVAAHQKLLAILALHRSRKPPNGVTAAQDWAEPVKFSRSFKEPIPPNAALPAGRHIVRRHSTSAPAHAIGDDPLDLRLVVHGKFLVARAEVHGASCPPVAATATAKYLTALETPH